MFRTLLLATLLVGCGNQVRVEAEDAPPTNVPSAPLPAGVCPQGEPTTIAKLASPNGLALSEQTLFLTDLGGLYDCTGSVQAIPLAGGAPEVLIQGLCAPNRIVHADGMLYWLNHSGYVAPNGNLSSLDLGNGGLATLAGGLISPDALAVDERYVFVGEQVEAALQSDGRLLRIDRQTNERVELAISEGLVADIALDNEYVYWTSSVGFLNGKPNHDSSVYRVSKQGGEKKRLVGNLAGAYAIARIDTRVLVVHSYEGEIIAFSANGEGATAIASSLNSPNDVASDGSDIFITTWGPPSNLFVLREDLPKSIAKTKGYADQIALGANCIYWTEQYVDEQFNGIVQSMAR